MNLLLSQVASYPSRTQCYHENSSESIIFANSVLPSLPFIVNFTIVIIAGVEFILPIGPELAVAGEDIVLSDDESAADDKPYYMTVNGKQASNSFFLPCVTVTLSSA